MVSSWLYNVSYNYTININLNDITGILYYPYLLIILIIIPIIVIMVTLFLKRSEEIKIFILSLNLIYLIFLPYLIIALIQDYKIKAYINSVILKDLLFINLYSEHDLILTFISQNILYIVLFEIILTIIPIIYYAFAYATKR